MNHVPVLLQEVLEYINPVGEEKKFIDATLGSGGHARSILNTNPKARILGIDWDQASLDKVKTKFAQEGLDRNCIFVSGNYKNLDKFADEQGFRPVDGILIDLGFSSAQIDDPIRGFTFQKAGPLDMRYSQSHTLTAEMVVNGYSVEKLAQIFKQYGEEKFARKIATAIVKHRQTKPLKTTGDLAPLIISALPAPIKYKATDSLRRVFQAIRIEVNSELSNLQEVLPKTLELLRPGGRLVIISFHSLEDRIVKEFLNEQAADCVCPREFPTCVCDKASTVRILTRKPITAGEAEQKNNPRSIPAKLRAAEKI